MKTEKLCYEFELEDHVPGMSIEPMALPDIEIPEDWDI